MGSRPFMHLSRVDLPEPEGPIITTTSLLETCRSTPRSTSNEPNLLCTSSSLIMLSFSSGLHPCHSAASSLLAFQPCGYTDEGYGEDHIDHCCSRQGRWTRCDAHLLTCPEQWLRCGYHGSQSRVLDHGDQLVGQWRHYDSHSLGQDDVAHRLCISHAQRASGLHLSKVDGFYSRAEDLRRIGAVAHGQAQYGRRYRVQYQKPEACLHPHQAKPVINEGEQEQEREAPEKVDVGA